MDEKTRKKIISEYKKGKSSLDIVKIVNLSKPTILKVLNENGLVRKRDRCSSLNIKKDGGKYYVIRKCPKCNENIKTVSKDKVMINIQKYGNTTAATLPLCLWDWEKQLKKGDNLILSAFGGGFTWGAIYLKWAYNS